VTEQTTGQTTEQTTGQATVPRNPIHVRVVGARITRPNGDVTLHYDVGEGASPKDAHAAGQERVRAVYPDAARIEWLTPAPQE
jgi:hypothetical protein